MFAKTLRQASGDFRFVSKGWPPRDSGRYQRPVCYFGPGRGRAVRTRGAPDGAARLGGAGCTGIIARTSILSSSRAEDIADEARDRKIHLDLSQLEGGADVVEFHALQLRGRELIKTIAHQRERDRDGRPASKDEPKFAASHGVVQFARLATRVLVIGSALNLCELLQISR